MDYTCVSVIPEAQLAVASLNPFFLLSDEFAFKRFVLCNGGKNLNTNYKLGSQQHTDVGWLRAAARTIHRGILNGRSENITHPPKVLEVGRTG